jgi:tetratricopeptide (TPR) repeat protein
MEKSPEILTAQYVNLGVEYYENGRVQDAMVAFAEALLMSKRIVEFDGDMHMTANVSLYDPSGPFRPQFGRSEKLMPSACDIFIFLNPIKVPGTLPATKLRKTLSLITMFNLAICNHRNAIINNMDRMALRKALQLYELAYAIQMQEEIDMTLTPTMIIMSNVGHIHKILGNADNAMQCFQHLLSTLMFLVEAGERDLVWEFDGFFQNIMKTIYAHSPAAAA